MKKLVLFVMAVMAFAGMSVAQDIYSSGYYVNSNNRHVAAVYRNGELLYERVPEVNYSYNSTDLDFYNGSVYWVRNCMNIDDTFNFGDVFINDNLWLSTAVGSGSHIYDLYRFSTGNESLWSVGCTTINGVKTAARWRNNEATAIQLGDGVNESVAFGATGYGDLYTCGYQYTSATDYHGVIWQATDVFIEFDPGTKILGIAYYAGCLYTVGTLTEGSNTSLKVWRTNMYDGTTSVQFSDLSSNAYDRPERTNIFVDDAGDIYVVGVTTGVDRLYKNGEEIYNTTAYFTSVSVNTDGVYYSGSTDNNGGYYGDQYGRIWKDGAYLYSPSDCQLVTNIFVEEPTCTNNEARSLPYFEGFETGATDWTCWTAADVDGQNSNFESYWHRGGDFRADIIHYGSDYCAWHEYNDEYPQEGWLISPVIRISEGSTAKLTFQSYERYPDDYGYEGVWVNPSTTAEEVWHASSDEVSDEWKTIEIDLSAYQGQDIVLGFKYTGDNAHNWYIDDVSIEQEAAPVEYTITTDVNPEGAGTVTGGGTYPAGTEVTLTAMANPGYVFSHWSDGLTTNPRTITVNGDANYTAYFIEGGGGTTYTVTVVSENPLLGSVTGGGTFPAGTVIQISATPNLQARFVSWDDGNTDNPRTIVVTGDVTYIARFEALQSYTITVVSANPAMGTVDGGGTFMEGTETSISATPLAGYYFIGWNDGNADNPRTITVTQNATYIAQFASSPVETFTLTVMCNDAEGSTIGSGTYTAGSTATIAAFPNNGYAFDKWNDGNMENPRQVVVNSNMTFVAFFKNTGIGENEGRLMVVYPNPANSYIRIEGLEANSEVKIYNAMGALVKVVSANAEEEISIADLASGLYLVRCGNATLRFVKEQ